LIEDLLLPRTDRGVLLQATVLFAVVVTSIAFVRRRYGSELVVLPVGLGLVGAGLMALRAIH
jgi:hypothetical protein